jgi:hypothetical protein
VPDDPQPDETPDAVSKTGQPVEPAAVDARGVPIPSEVELAAVAEPAVVRHAPKYGAFITAGAVVGIVVALVLVAIIRPEAPWVSDGSGFISFLDGEGAVRTVMAVAGAVLGGFVGGALAVLADRRSVRRAHSADV